MKTYSTYIKKSVFIFALLFVCKAEGAAPIGSTPPHTFQNGQTANPSEVNENFIPLYQHLYTITSYIKNTFSGKTITVELGKKGDTTNVVLPTGFNNFNVAPLGSIVAWYPLSGTPALPDGWVKCDGQTLTDPEVSASLKKVPNLNSTQLFLRGNSSLQAGVIQEDQILTHTHNESHFHAGGSASIPSGFNSPVKYKECPTKNPSGGPLYGNPTSTAYAHTGVPSNYFDSSNPVHQGSETRPINMSVIWIMRVK